MLEKIRIYNHYGKVKAEIPGIATGVGDSAEKALRSLCYKMRSVQDVCLTCWNNDIKSYIVDHEWYQETIIECKACKSVSKHRSYYHDGFSQEDVAIHGIQ